MRCVGWGRFLLASQPWSAACRCSFYDVEFRFVLRRVELRDGLAFLHPHAFFQQHFGDDASLGAGDDNGLVGLRAAGHIGAQQCGKRPANVREMRFMRRAASLRPAMFVAIVTTPGSPAWWMISASCASCFALSNRNGNLSAASSSASSSLFATLRVLPQTQAARERGVALCLRRLRRALFRY